MDDEIFAAYARGDRAAIERIRAERDRAAKAKKDAVRARADAARDASRDAMSASFSAAAARGIFERAVACDNAGDLRGALPLYERWLAVAARALQLPPMQVQNVVRSVILDDARAGAVAKFSEVERRAQAIRAALGIAEPVPEKTVMAPVAEKPLEGPITETRPTRTLDDVCGYAGTVDVLRNLADTVHIRYGDDEARGRLSALLYGVPGTGKTTLAKAFAGTLGCVMLCVSADELFNKYVGESERRLQAMLQQARDVARRDGKCVFFFDEVDRLFGEDSTGVTSKLLQVMLTGLDDMHENRAQGAVFFLSTTNHPWRIDGAFRRRLGRQLEVGLPDAAAREAMIAGLCASEKLRLAMPIVGELVDLTEGFSGADIYDCFGTEPRTIGEDAKFVCIGGRWTLGDGPDARERRELRAMGADMHLPPLGAEAVRELVRGWTRSTSAEDHAAIRRYAGNN